MEWNEYGDKLYGISGADKDSAKAIIREFQIWQSKGGSPSEFTSETFETFVRRLGNLCEAVNFVAKSVHENTHLTEEESINVLLNLLGSLGMYEKSIHNACIYLHSAFTGKKEPKPAIDTSQKRLDEEIHKYNKLLNAYKKRGDELKAQVSRCEELEAELEQLRSEVERLRSELELSKTAAQRNWDKGKQALREAQERARNGEHRKYKPRKDTYDEKYGHMVRKMYAVGGKSYREIQKETGLSLNVISRLVQKYKLSEHKGQCVEYNGELKLKSEVPAEYLEQLANKKKRGRPRKNPVNE